jgi:pyridoxamine 5'-phosphate oxidase
MSSSSASRTPLPEIAIEASPMTTFETWFQEAIAAEPNDPNAMALATVDASGLPDLRMVLLKGHDERGFVFYTNLESAKGAELKANPKVALLFHWKSLRRQVRIRGPVTPVTTAESDAYFSSRPRGSQIASIASRQSSPLKNRAELEAEVAKVAAQYPEGDLPRPDRWAGFRVSPVQIEFWRDGLYRMHDRLVYRRAGVDESWTTERLFP